MPIFPNLAEVIYGLFLNQTLVYWPKLGSDGFGKPTYDTPVELACRWDDKQQEVLLPSGRKVMSRGYLVMIDPTVAGGLVRLGTLLDWQALPTFPLLPTANQGGSEIVLVKTTADLDAQDFIYEAYL